MDRNAVFSIVMLTKAQVHSVPSAALGTIGHHSLPPKESAKGLIGCAIQLQFTPSHVHATALRIITLQENIYLSILTLPVRVRILRLNYTDALLNLAKFRKLSSAQKISQFRNLTSTYQNS